MPVRFVEAQSQDRNTTVDRSLSNAAEKLAIIMAARGGFSLGNSGEVVQIPTEPWPIINPTTGAYTEPTPAPEYFRAGSKAGTIVKPGVSP
ncbi:hypothetical protein IAD21_00870 [Abditibacteriota bacterium]|nr:hypothetical protein IAD21_00870 [Abditibacteriota bacterium]